MMRVHDVHLLALRAGIWRERQSIAKSFCNATLFLWSHQNRRYCSWISGARARLNLWLKNQTLIRHQHPPPPPLEYYHKGWIAQTYQRWPGMQSIWNLSTVLQAAELLQVVLMRLQEHLFLHLLIIREHHLPIPVILCPATHHFFPL